MGFNLTPAGNPGFWGPITSTLDWCEENYLLTFYIAEFWNTLSNLLYLIFTALGIFLFWRCGSETRSIAAMTGLGVVGIGSFLFHGSLLFETQMMDELPMIYATCFLVYNNLLLFPSSDRYKVPIATFLFLYSIIVTGVYLYVKNPVFHEVCYAALTAIMVFSPFWEIPKLGRKYPEKERGLWILHVYSLVCYLTGFALWNTENFNCDSIRSWRNTQGYPLRVFAELHAWWHIGTAFGTYAGCLLNAYMRLLALDRRDVSLKWMFIPYISTPLSRKEILATQLKKKSE